MIAMTMAELADITGGSLHDADPDVQVTAPATVDSRQVEPGSLFVAIEGERTDGHRFAGRAVAGGAAAVLCTKAVDAPSLLVEDAVIALGKIAAQVVRRLDHCTVVGITGSQGKTGTKDLLRQILSAHGETVAPQGSFNNELGVPLTICQATESTRFLISEMGARGPGHIAYLCGIALPRIGMVLNVGVAHLGEFGSRDNIAAAKGELVESLPPGGTAVLNADDDAVAAMAARTTARVSYFGLHRGADVRIEDLSVAGTGEPSFSLVVGERRAAVRLPLLGEHQALNAAAATAAALAAGIDLDDIVATLTHARSLSSWRMERHQREDGLVVVNDAYNANPDSMRAAVRTLATMVGGRTHGVAVLGTMLELGDGSSQEHAAIGRLVVEEGLSLVAVGDGALDIHHGALDAAKSTTWDGSSVAVGSVEEAVAWLEDHLSPSDVILVKASRAAGLERVAASLLQGSRHTSVVASRVPTRDHGDVQDPQQEPHEGTQTR